MDKCQACGIPLIEHHGLMHTCGMLIVTRRIAGVLEKSNLRLKENVAALTRKLKAAKGSK